MIRIGILGSDNSHSVAFSQLCNLKAKGKGKRISGARVVALFGLNDKRNKEVAKLGNIPTIVKRPTDMLGMVDAVIVDFRHGEVHYKYAMPFIKAGIPTFVDKPLACSMTHARKMLEAARRKRTPIMSASAVRYSERVEAFKKSMKNIGKLRAGILTGRGNAESEYGGIFFYGIHSVEMMIEIFGGAVRSIRATEHDGSVVATVDYKNNAVITLNIMDKSNVPFTAGAFGTKGIVQHNSELSTGYYPIMKVFLDMVKTGKIPISHKDLLLSVRVLDAMQKSIDRDGQEIVLK